MCYALIIFSLSHASALGRSGIVQVTRCPTRRHRRPGFPIPSMTAPRMGSKSSKAKSPTPTETVIPRIPQEIIDEILDHLAADLTSLRSCALVSKSWLPSCRRHLFHTTFFNSETAKWFETLQEPEDSPARHVRDLRFSIRGYYGAPEKFFEYIPWFTNVEKVTLSGHGRYQPLRVPWLWKLPQSVTSLTINTGVVTVAQIRDIIVQLPNLDDLSLSGSIVAADKRTLVGIGAALRGRFCGQLRLLKGHTNEDIVDMLLEVPTGLHFTDVQICGTYECLFSIVRLAEACCETIVKLSYAVSAYCESQPFLRSSCTFTPTPPPNVDGDEVFQRAFDFSKFPNLQEVEFGVGWMRGGLLWIPLALSTLRPATSPHLSTVKLHFSRSPVASVGALAENTPRYDLLLVAGETARIGREFEGTVNLTVLRDPVFQAVFNALNVRFHFYGVHDSTSRPC